ncbi:hypothetical protein PR048_015117 [Dryococelus australis]|uniref:Uncharacterized protein n=1 Tax=Dryococelus australis TaxID=614101 RepID=A0ABQ9HG35_9NEOP|nr:hypothetical protein PR048_015117 [Dryococelus australis]
MALNIEVLRADECDCNEYAAAPKYKDGGTGHHRENPLINGIVQHDSHMRKPGVNRPGLNLDRLVSVMPSDIPELKGSAAVRSTSSSSFISSASTAEIPICLLKFPGPLGMFDMETAEVSSSSSAEATASPTRQTTRPRWLSD